MRTMHDAILIGIGTALNDNPQLNGESVLSLIERNRSMHSVRRLPPSPEHRPYHLPRPIILDTGLRLDVSCRLLQNYQAGSGRRPWIMAAIPKATGAEEWFTRRNALETAGAIIIPVPVENGDILPNDHARQI
jgi:2,5-diamino-6-(ribosylamino)-4(3H)-pyrimidinone 5'-phosphate reductase